MKAAPAFDGACSFSGRGNDSGEKQSSRVPAGKAPVDELGCLSSGHGKLRQSALIAWRAMAACSKPNLGQPSSSIANVDRYKW
jgi:hypothetical protein